jgi:AraC-like DNA-binding protein
VDLASELLHHGEKTLAEITETCGFCDQSYFTRVFQGVKGVTPKQFREASPVNGVKVKAAGR